MSVSAQPTTQVGPEPYYNHGVTRFVDHTNKHEECFGIMITKYDGKPYMNIISTKFGFSYSSTGGVKSSLKMRNWLYCIGEKLEDIVHIVSVERMTECMLGNDSLTELGI